MWVLRPDCLLGPYDVAQATRLTDDSLYVGKLIRRRDGQRVLLAFINWTLTAPLSGRSVTPCRS